MNTEIPVKDLYKRATSHIAACYVPTDDDPMCVHILPSGWDKPKMYHVIIEHGDMDRADHELLSAEQIKEKLRIDISEVKTPHDVMISNKMIKDRPDDQNLGAFVREKSYAND